jgi:hypothetical protein
MIRQPHTMPVENIDALSDEVIERRALKVLQRADASRRRLPTDCDPLTRADYRAAYNLLVGSNVPDHRGLTHRRFLEEGTEGEICARQAMGRMLRRLARSRIDDEEASILVLLAAHFDGKTGYGTVPDGDRHKAKWPIMELAAERRLKFEGQAPTGIPHRRMSVVLDVWNRLHYRRSIPAKRAMEAVFGWAANERSRAEAWVKKASLQLRSMFQRLASSPNYE